MESIFPEIGDHGHSTIHTNCYNLSCLGSNLLYLKQNLFQEIINQRYQRNRTKQFPKKQNFP